MSDLTPDLRSMPEEVLEEAAKAIHASDDPSGKLPTWEEDGEGDRDVYRVNARAAYPALARWVTARVLDEAAHRIRSGDQSRDPYEREAVGYVVDKLQQFANEAEAVRHD